MRIKNTLKCQPDIEIQDITFHFKIKIVNSILSNFSKEIDNILDDSILSHS